MRLVKDAKLCKSMCVGVTCHENGEVLRLQPRAVMACCKPFTQNADATGLATLGLTILADEEPHGYFMLLA